MKKQIGLIFLPTEILAASCLLCFASGHNDTVSLPSIISRFTDGSFSLCGPHSHTHNTYTQYYSAGSHPALCFSYRQLADFKALFSA